MITQKSMRLFSLVLILHMVISIGFVNSKENNQPSSFYDYNLAAIEINDFSDFQILYDEPQLYCLKTDASLDFTYYGGSSEYFLMRYYYLPLTDYGNCSNYDIEISIDYDFTGSTLYGRFEVIVGSFYDESGVYFGEPNGASLDDPCDPAKPLSKCNVIDYWSESGGQFRVCAYPYDTQERYNTEHGATGTSGTALFHMNRYNNRIDCQVKQGGTTKVSHVWNNYVTKPMNFILIGEGIYGEDAEFAKASFYDFSAKLEFPDLASVKIGPQFIGIIFISFSGLVFLMVIFRKSRKY